MKAVQIQVQVPDGTERRAEFETYSGALNYIKKWVGHVASDTNVVVGVDGTCKATCNVGIRTCSRTGRAGAGR